ncbi:MAG: ACP S-malonyltransferase [Clostridiales bacterium]|nr:ACP S-malonyltransferase [Clostridiales bacterium]
MSYGIVFTGQGSQVPSMAKELIRNYASAKELFSEADHILGYSLTALCSNEEDYDRLNYTRFSQPAIFVTEYALFYVLKEYLQENEYLPSFMAGHSLGEYTALASGGVMSFADTLRLVSRRGEYMSASAEEMDSTMVAVSGMPDDATLIFDDYLQKHHDIFVACENSNTQTVYSMPKKLVKEFAGVTSKQGARTKELSVEGGFHSAFMSSAKCKLEEEVKRYDFKEATCQIYANVSGDVYQSVDEIKKLLPEQLTNRVRWKDIVEKIVASRPDFVLEIGPAPVLSYGLKKVMAAEKVIHVGPTSDITEISREIRERTNEKNRKELKGIVRALVCSKSDGTMETLLRRERAYDYLMDLIKGGAVDSRQVAAAKNRCRELVQRVVL